MITKNTMARTINIALIISSIFLEVKETTSTAAGQETLIGIQGKDFIMIGADSSTSGNGGISFTSNSMDKIHEIILPQKENNSKEQQGIMMATAGDIADCDYINSIVSSHAKIREFEYSLGSDVQYVFHGNNNNEVIDDNNLGLDASNIAHLARNEISYRLRSRSPLRVNLLIAGMVPYYSSKCKINDINNDIKEDETRKISNTSSLLSKRIYTQITKAIKDRVLPQKKYNDDDYDNPIIHKEKIKDTQLDTTITTKKYSKGNNKSYIILKPHLYWLDEYGSNQKNIPYSVHGHASNFALSILDQNYENNMGKDDVLALIKDCFRQLRTRYIINTAGGGSDDGDGNDRSICVKCIDKYGVTIYEI